jgi:urease accessory protein
MKYTSLITAATVSLAATPAMAHVTGAPHDSGLLSGLLHPLMGVDHILAMVAVGLLAFMGQGAARLVLPALFVSAMLLGGGLALQGMALPFVEAGIAGSVIILGGVIALGRRLPAGVAPALTILFGLFHGTAHGAEMPAALSALTYSAGFAVATMALHGAGLTIGWATMRAARHMAPRLLRTAGALTATAGLVLATA